MELSRTGSRHGTPFLSPETGVHHQPLSPGRGRRTVHWARAVRPDYVTSRLILVTTYASDRVNLNFCRRDTIR